MTHHVQFPPYLPRDKIDGEPHPVDVAERPVLGQTVPGIEHHVLAVVQRILRRATCRLREGARLSPSARIRNIRGDTDKIVVGRRTMVMGELLTFAHGGEISIGEWCYVGEGSRIWSAASIHIGDRVLISHSANVFDNTTHPIRAADRHEQFQPLARSEPAVVTELGDGHALGE